MTRLLLTMLLVLTLAGCGFHPRGALPLAPPLHYLYLRSSDPYGDLSRNLKKTLEYQGVHFTYCANRANVVLEIISESTNDQLLSVSASQQTRQYNLTLTVIFQLTTPSGLVLVPPQTVTEIRTMPIQSNQILAGSNEATILYHQMRFAIIDDIINILTSPAVNYHVTHP